MRDTSIIAGLQKAADRADVSVLFFSSGAKFWTIYAPTKLIPELPALCGQSRIINTVLSEYEIYTRNQEVKGIADS